MVHAACISNVCSDTMVASASTQDPCACAKCMVLCALPSRDGVFQTVHDIVGTQQQPKSVAVGQC
jgi:hypothetical protein